MTPIRKEAHWKPLAEQFQELCRNQDSLPDVFAFLDAAEVADLRTRVEVLLVDQALRIERGSLRPVEEYFAHCPEITESQALSLELAAGEYYRRTDQGETVSREVFLSRFPHLRTHLNRLLDSAPADSSEPGITQDLPRDSLFQDSSDSAENTSENTSDSLAETLETDPVEQTIEVSAESILTPQRTDQNTPRKTEQREPTEQVAHTDSGSNVDADVDADTNSDATSISDASQNTVDATVDIDPKSLDNMMEEFDKETAGRAQPTPGSSPSRGKEDIPVTLFMEGAAYDESRELGDFGGYELLGEIARGGMGVVFKARQRKLKRLVALKMILAGNLADAEDIRRFYAEAEAAAGLDHPNIVPIYEVGEYRGQHFFSMAYIEGQSLADRIAEHPLSATEAARVMKTIAEAVHYAHEHGVIHRDLKPANVLLDAHDQPKITDFGLAKRTEADAEITATGQIMGTPSYMSPEQISGDSRRVGPPSDLFALGGLLYCLLTGRPPFQAPSVLELLKKVKDEEPVSPGRLTANLPPDLETICLKCLAKEPHRRYESAQALAEDLDRFLRGVPVLARPVGPAERTWRWCKRHPAVAGLMAAFVCSLLLGAGFSTYYAIAASRRAEEAMEQYERAETNFARAEENFRKAQNAVDQFFVQVSENTLLNQPGMQPLQHKLLNQALEYYQAFLKERGDDPDLKDQLAITHFRVGIITEMVESPQAAIPALETARSSLTEILDQKPDDWETRQMLGNTLTALGRVRYRTNGYLDAEEIFQEALLVREELAALKTDDPEAQRELANAYMNRGLVERGRSQSANDEDQRIAALERAVEFYNQAQQIRRDLLKRGDLSSEMLRKIHRDAGQGGYNLGTILLQMGETGQGLESYRQAAADFEEALDIEPEDQRTTFQLAICYRVLATGGAAPDKAWSYCRRALSHLDPLVRKNPQIADYRKELASLHHDRGDIARRLNKLPEAKQAYRESRELLEKLREDHPRDLKLLLNMLTISRSLAELTRAGATEAADFLSREKLGEIPGDLQKSLGEKNANSRIRGELAVELFQLGQQLHRLGHSDLALELSRQGVAMTETLAEEDEGNLNHHQNYHLGLELVARLLVHLQDYDQAREVYEKRLSVLSRLADQFPKRRAFFQNELDRTNRFLDELAKRPAIAEKPAKPSKQSRTGVDLP